MLARWDPLAPERPHAPADGSPGVVVGDDTGRLPRVCHRPARDVWRWVTTSPPKQPERTPMPETVFDPVELPSRYAKAIVAILTAAATVLVAALTDGLVTTVETVSVAVAILTAISVYLVPNLPDGVGRYAKLGVAILGTALQALVDVLATGSLTSQGILVVLLAALGAVSVGIVPNATPGYTPEHAAEDVQA